MRGTVLDREGNLVAKAFPKFFNMEEHKPEEIPMEEFEVFEKLDGSLGILFHYADEWHLATRGSFVSDQAIKGKEILSRYSYKRLIPGFTYLFEIIYPENRIVCSYDYEDLIMLAVIDNKDGYELRIHDNHIHLDGIRLANLYQNLGIKIVNKYDGVTDYKRLKTMIASNAEGFVIKFKSGFRMKIKGEEYVRLHRLLTNFSNVDIWELLKDGKNLDDFLERVPDEFDEWVRGTMRALKFEFTQRMNRVKNLEFSLKSLSLPTRKEEAEWIFENVERIYQGCVFSLLDGKDPSEHVWKLTRPTYQKPFWNKKED
jgi:RNA ligase